MSLGLGHSGGSSLKARFQIAAEARRASRAAIALVVRVRPDQTRRLTISFSVSGWIAGAEARCLVGLSDTVTE